MSVEHELVAIELEAARHERGNALRAARDLEDTVAGAALEVMVVLGSSGFSEESKMEINRCGSQPSGRGPSEWFTGTVRIDPLFQAYAPARTAGAAVTFEPGARTAWHTHPLGRG